MDNLDVAKINPESLKPVDPQIIEAIKEFVKKCDGPLFCDLPFTCGPKLWGPVTCGTPFFDAVTKEFAVCADGFYKGCSRFGEIVGPVCPGFDPVDRIKDWRIQERFEELHVKVKELETRLAKPK